MTDIEMDDLRERGEDRPPEDEDREQEGETTFNHLEDKNLVTIDPDENVRENPSSSPGPCGSSRPAKGPGIDHSGSAYFLH